MGLPANIEKNCKKHGWLKPEEILVYEDERYKAGYVLRCALCKNEDAWKYQSKNCSKHGALTSEDIDSQGRCRFCQSEKANEWKKRNREYINAKIAQDKKDNPEKWEKYYKEEYRRKKARHGKKIVTTEILRLRNLTQKQYDEMFERQAHKCKICGQEETRKSRTRGEIAKLVVDHNHDTGQIRGLLCHKCNLLIGYARDDIEILHMAIIYLQDNA